MFLLKIKQFLKVWLECILSMKRPRLFVPFIMMAIIQFLGLLTLLNFFKFPFNNVLIPLISKFFGENVLHYPESYLVLPSLFSIINIILGGIFGIIIIGIATLLFATNYQNKGWPKKLGFNQVLPKYGVLFVLWLIQAIFVLSIVIGLPLLFQKLVDIGYTEMRFVQLISFLLGLFVASIFAYTSAAVVLDNQKINKALGTSLDIFSKNIIYTFLFVSVPNLVNYLMNFVTNRPQFLILKFNPEIIAILISITILVSIFTNFILIGSLTRYYIIQKES